LLQCCYWSSEKGNFSVTKKNKKNLHKLGKSSSVQNRKLTLAEAESEGGNEGKRLKVAKVNFNFLNPVVFTELLPK
jgi:hypothetical protein